MGCSSNKSTETPPPATAGGNGGSETGGNTQEDLDNEEERKKIAAMQNRGKRNSVAGVGASEDEIKNYVPPSFPKSDASKAMLAETLKTNPKMQTLGLDKLKSEHLDEMVMAFQEKLIKKDEYVIKQGEDGDCLYVIETGNFDIFVSRKNADGSLGESAKVANFGPKMLFGELAVLYSSARAATVRCATADAKAWQLDSKPFQMLLKKHGIEKVEQYSGWLTNVDLLKVLTLHEISQLADACESVLVEKGEVLMKQGDPGDSFFILEEGTATAYFEVNGSEKEVKVYDQQGQYFGELALITGAPRKATVKAMSDGSLLRISKETFDGVLGPIIDRLKEQSDKYPQYADILKGNS